MSEPSQIPNGSTLGPTFTGPDGEEYAYADPAESPSMDDVDSTTIGDPEGAPTDDVDPAGESTPGPVL